MTDLPAWEQQIRRTLADISGNGTQLARSLEAVRGRGEARSVTIEVNAYGDITAINIAPGAMRWRSTQLEAALVDCHRHARADAKTKSERIIRKADPRLHQPMRDLLGDAPADDTHRRPRTEEEIQAADDAFFERMNRFGWHQ